DDIERDHNILRGIRQFRKRCHKVPLLNTVDAKMACNGDLLLRYVDPMEPMISGFTRKMEKSAVPAAEVENGSSLFRGEMLMNNGPQSRSPWREAGDGAGRSGLLPCINVTSVQALAHKRTHADCLDRSRMVSHADIPIS